MEKSGSSGMGMWIVLLVMRINSKSPVTLIIMSYRISSLSPLCTPHVKTISKGLCGRNCYNRIVVAINLGALLAILMLSPLERKKWEGFLII